jgi:hypothetical protein
VGKSLEDYMKYNRRTRRKDHYVQGFDEILFFEPIPPENVKLIGQWDEGIFVFSKPVLSTQFPVPAYPKLNQEKQDEKSYGEEDWNCLT